MTNTNIEYCEETHKDGWICCYPKAHRGDHKAWGGNKANPFATWPQEQKQTVCADLNTAKHPTLPVTYRCNREKDHAGNHEGWSIPSEHSFKSWPQEQPSPFAKGGFEPKNCTSTHRVGNGGKLTCQLKAGHPGSHLKTFLTRDTVTWKDDVAYTYVSGRGYGKTSFRQTMTPVFVTEEEPTAGMEFPVFLTVEELKAISYAFSGPEWREDEPELAAKLDKALKEAL